MKQTPFHKLIKKYGAKIASFSDWEMPIYFSSIKDEHNSVRKNVGLFDISHMGIITINGSDAHSFIDTLLPSNIIKMENFTALYSPLCNELGYILDDIIVYKNSTTDFFLIVNASNIDKDYNWILKRNNSLNFNLNINNLSEYMAGIAIQGPKSKIILEKFINNNINDLNYYNFKHINDLIVSRTGYSGELGYELWFNTSTSDKFVNNIWNFFVNKEKTTLCGLASRDILRLEAGYSLYGNELNENISPLEAGLNWTLDLDKNSFIGKDAILKLKNNLNKKLVGIEMLENRIPRQNYRLFNINNEEIGFITSGTYSFTLEKNIGLAYVKPEYNKGDIIFVDIRGTKIKSKIVCKRFYYNKEIKKEF